MINRLGCKLTLITAMGIYVFYMAVNIRPRFFGYFFMIIHSGQVFGNLLSSFIMTAAMKPSDPLDEVYKT
ncbi:hypothetical protein ANCDUO_24009 [Ancylostoma duodenale]|uniref:Uncharacterized protein n=1 Tax=Ancylostoma duodenale TaxID=51022 RepID=A0A0C2FBL1_9BILA|nr:hypothetical protein ANCDUO_24009 [Ancylostoma duodenale]